MSSPVRSTATLWVLLVLALALTGLVAPPQAEAQDATTFDYAADAQVATLSQPEFTKIKKSNEYVDVPGDGSPERLYVEVTRPDPGLYGNGPWPVVMEASPYHGTLADREGTRIFPDPRDEDGNMIGMTGYFAQRGYAVVMVDLRGTGRSTGCLDHLGPNDAADLKAIVEWAANEPWSNGRVGMTGHSYVGSTPKVAAAQNPQGLVTIAPSAGLASMYDHQYQYGVPYLLQWVGPMFAYELLSLERHEPGGDNFGGPPPEECAVLHSSLVSDESQVTGKYDADAPFAWHAKRDHRAGATAADIPVFMIHGVNDNAARIPAAEWFFGHRYDHVTTDGHADKTWIGQWDHGSSANTTCVQGHPNCRFEQWQYALHAWFDKHLAQRDVETGPAMEAFLNGDVVYADDGWKEPVFQSLYPDKDGTLKFAPPGEPGQVSFNTAPVRGGFTEFTSEPVDQDTLFRGLPQQFLKASLLGTNPEAFHLVTTLYNEGPPNADGERERLPMNFCAIQPSLRDSPKDEPFKPTQYSPILAGQEMDLDPQCFTMAHLLPKGHRLVLRVGTGSPHHVSGLANPFAADRVTVYTGPDASRYDVPWTTTFSTVDDVEIPVPGVPEYDVPDAPAQPPVCGEVLIPGTGGEFRIDQFNVAYFEFESKPQYGNARLDVLAEPNLPADVDLFLQYMQEDGTWSEDLNVQGGGSFDFEKETMSYTNPIPGKYRVGVVNWAGAAPLTVDICVTFYDSAGNAGVKDEDDTKKPDPTNPTERPPGSDEDPGPTSHDDPNVGVDDDERGPVLPATGGGAVALGVALLTAAGLLFRRRRN